MICLDLFASKFADHKCCERKVAAAAAAAAAAADAAAAAAAAAFIFLPRPDPVDMQTVVSFVELSRTSRVEQPRPSWLKRLESELHCDVRHRTRQVRATGALVAAKQKILGCTHDIRHVGWVS